MHLELLVAGADCEVQVLRIVEEAIAGSVLLNAMLTVMAASLHSL